MDMESIPMRRNPEFLLREVAGTIVVVPVGQATTAFPGMITMNPTGAFLWEKLETEHTVETLVAALVEHYEVTVEKAQADVVSFVEKLVPTGAILEQ